MASEAELRLRERLSKLRSLPLLGGGSRCGHARGLPAGAEKLFRFSLESFNTLPILGQSGLRFFDLAVGAVLDDFPNRVPVQVGDAGEVFLIPTALLDQAGNLAGQIGPRRIRAVHSFP